MLALLLLGACEQHQADPQVHLDRAWALKEKGEFRSAVLELKNALQLDPSNLEARLALGRLHLVLGDGFSAEKELQRVLEPGFVQEAEVAVDLARARVLKGDSEALILRSPQSTLSSIYSFGLDAAQKAKLISLHGHGFLMGGRQNDALLLYQTALEANPEEPEACVGMATLAFGRREIGEAREWIAKAIAVDQEFSSAWSLMGDLERFQGNPREAEEAYTRAIEHRFNQAHDLLGRALVRIARGDLVGAEADAKRLEHFRQKRARVSYLRGLLAFQQKEYREALSAFQQTLAQEESYMPAVYYAGLSAALMDQLNQADYYFSEYIRANPDSALAYKQLATVRIREGDLVGAERLLEGVIRVHPKDAQALDLMGTAELLKGDREQAVEHLERASLEQPGSALAYMKLGVGLLAQGDVKRAGKVLEQAREQAPGSVEAQVLLIQRHIAAGEFDKARNSAEEMGERLPKQSVPDDLLGLIGIKQGDKEAAQSAFTSALEKNPADFTAASALASLALERGGHDEARAYLERFLEANPGHAQALISLADIAILQKRPDDALQLLEKARAANPDAWRPRVLLSHHYQALGKPRKALEIGEEAKENHPRNPIVLKTVGQAALAAGAANSAEASLRLLTELRPESAEAHFLLAQALNAAGSVKASREALEKSIRLDPQRNDAKIVLARMWLAEGEIDRAEQLSNEVNKALPDNPDARALEGEVATRRDRPAQAVDAYRKALTGAQVTGLAKRLARLQLTAGDPDGAIATLEEWLQAHPDDASARYSLGNIYFALRKRDKAKAYYQTLIENGTANATVHSNLSQLLIVAGEIDPALSHAKRALEMEPGNAILLDNLGLIYLGTAKPREALRLFELALDRAPEQPAYVYHKAVALRETGRPEEALQLLTPLLQDDTSFSERRQAEALLQLLRKATAEAAEGGSE